MAITFNYTDHEIVSSPTVIVSGRTSAPVNGGVVEFINSENRVFPPQYFEVNNGQFKAIVHVSPDTNKFSVRVMDNGTINPFGFPDYRGRSPNVVDSASLTLSYYPLTEDKPVHLCVILGKDSNGAYDMPQYKTARGEVANLDSAIRKLKVAGRLMQAYTQDEMRLSGFSNRSFQFVEETTGHQDIFGYTVQSPAPHQEVKVHVLRSPKTVAQLRDPNLAQQNPKGTNTGGLFSHALDLIHDTPELFSQRQRLNTCIQCAVIYLDAHYDAPNDLILTHAALGGGTGDIKLAIFGSHGLHSWPINFPMVTPCFVDGTHLSKREVANDANQCGTSWECLNITMGAFMHEIGHSLSCPHQIDGVMLRDYIWWNRSFMTREVECLRSKSGGEVIGATGQWPRSCHWNILDKVRFLFHGSFALPIDKNDPSMGHVFSTTLANDDSYGDVNKAPTMYNTPSGDCIVKSDAGVFLVEVITKDLARCHIPYFPRSYGGQGLQKDLLLDYNTLYDQLRSSTKEVNENFSVRVLSLGGDLYIDNFKDHSKNDSKNIIRHDFGLGRGPLTGYKSVLLGNGKDKQEIVIGFDINTVYKIRVYHGGVLDGIRFYYRTGSGSGFTNSPPPIPKRDYVSKLANKMGRLNVAAASATPAPKAPSGQPSSKPAEALLGNVKSHYTDIDLASGETITKLHFRNGAWIDAVQIEFSSGRKTEMLGNNGGGHLSTLEAPGHGYTLVGMYGYVGSWLNGVGIIYTNEL
ncbi:hypothetical protein PSN45_002937 [Yamadazyma tenuis]|uniref:Jacalin-type lectin domain-containing protein n=1 Tax=Candida tenuis (strain ATCC 10573 / BCRC 21748 / CBS 615 / JCM 9827 / NBRC 10315 / NRRL Y-1498 / VKM Y-70) TaxID=590646 RepID=G3AW64_CANTC|nr:uncharacterized protein CANTEDRAFT_96507 [Yamadazyma tenuis ATCC 10573]EGV66462.1 hypothetical protein CANTEDRAFT_96507 [Yamadazyma tenuis ATCC 10573]WEJ95418.1 hypothetical protein PSN45_002937 [Yamadazyma tenuis]